MFGRQYDVNEDENSNDNSTMLKKMTNIIEVEPSYTKFFILIGIGLGFIFLSLTCIPFVMISPHNFITLFSIGSILTIGSFIFVYGTKEYVSKLVERERVVFTLAYLISLFLGIYYGMIQKYYFPSLLCAIIQSVTLVIFILTFIPGGKSGISAILSMVKYPFKAIAMKIRGESYLPF